MRKYQQLTQAERYQIELGLQRGLSLRAQARILGRPVSTLSRELKRNQIHKRDEDKNQSFLYTADLAQNLAQARKHQARPQARRIKGWMRSWVIKRLRMRWSPEQISGRFEHEFSKKPPCPLSIYRFIERERKECRSFLKPYLRSRRLYARVHKGKKAAFLNSYLASVANRVCIDQRPRFVNARIRIGDYERDTLQGKENKARLLSIVDRSSRRIRMAWLPGKNAMITHQATVQLLKNQTVHTLTNDHGGEFQEHERTGRALKAQVYFCHPQCSWERGTNENTNGLIREYFPKKMDFRTIQKQEVKQVERLLNRRPRKCLDFQTPEEVHRAKTRSSVALGV